MDGHKDLRQYPWQIVRVLPRLRELFLLNVVADTSIFINISLTALVLLIVNYTYSTGFVLCPIRAWISQHNNHVDFQTLIPQATMCLPAPGKTA